MLDHSVREKLLDLVERASDKANQQLDEPACRQLLAILTQSSDDYMNLVHNVLWIKLQANHAHTRLLALHIADRVFRKFRSFRKLVCADFQGFLEATVGYNRTKPLPPPVTAAETLRQHSLEVIERWRDEHGKQCPQAVANQGSTTQHAALASSSQQIVAGCRYLRDCLGLRLPELRARAAQRRDQQLGRQARTQQLMLERYRQLPQQLEELAVEVQRLLTQLRECSDLLAGRPSATAQPAAIAETEADVSASTAARAGAGLAAGAGLESAAGEAAPAAAGETAPAAAAAAAGEAAAAAAGGPGSIAVEWEDVPVQSPPMSAAYAGANWRSCFDDGGGEGLAAYATTSDVVPAAARPSLPRPEHLDQEAVQGLLDVMSGIASQLASRSVPRLQGWLTLLVRLDVDGSTAAAGGSTTAAGSGTSTGVGAGLAGSRSGDGNAGRARDRLLREVISLRNSIQDALAVAQEQGAHVPEAAFRRSSDSAPTAVNITLNVTEDGVAEDDLADDVAEGDDDMAGGVAEGDDELAEDVAEDDARSGSRSGDDDRVNPGTMLGRLIPDPGAVQYGHRKQYRGSSLLRSMQGSGPGGPLVLSAHGQEQLQGSSMVTAGSAAHGQGAARGSGGSRAPTSTAATAAAAAKASYNDRVISAASDEAVARTLQEEEVHKVGQARQQQQQQQQQQQAGGRPPKRAKLTGKALIKKKLGL